MAYAVRVIISLLIAAAITMGLFSVMTALIFTADKDAEKEKAYKMVSILLDKQDIEARGKERKPDKPKQNNEPPPDAPKPQMDNFKINPDAISFSAPKVDASMDIGLNSLGTGDGEYLPLMKAPHTYPRRAVSRGIEGYVIVEYTVTRAGTTRDARVIRGQPSGMFDRSCLRAAAKYKYKPRVVDGQPIEVSGVRSQCTFEMEK